MAAGIGKRMLPLTKNLPKPLLKIHGKCLIEYHLDALQRAGISEIVINISYLGGMIEAALGNGRERGLDIRYSREPVPLETAGGIKNALPLLRDRASEDRDGANEAFLVVGGDVYTDFDFSELALRQCSTDAHMIMVDNPAHHPEGDFGINMDGFLESGGKLLTYSTIALYRPSFFLGLRDGPVMLRELFDRNLENNQISADYFAGAWNDVGTPERLEFLNQ